MKYLIDSDFLFGLFVLHDSHHKNATSIIRKIDKTNELVVSNLVIQETATVLSAKVGQSMALLFLEEIAKLPVQILFVGEVDENLGWNVFKELTKKRT